MFLFAMLASAAFKRTCFCTRFPESLLFLELTVKKEEEAKHSFSVNIAAKEPK
jgi:hypothetical protein